jgi:ABC-type molybdate transport system ATPase subunit
MIYVSHDRAEVERLATQIVHIPQSNARAGFGFLPTAS